MMRRIGQETFTAFQIQLNAKLNEIMPYYNMMIDSIDGLDIIKEITSKVVLITQRQRQVLKMNLLLIQTKDILILPKIILQIYKMENMLQNIIMIQTQIIHH